MTFEIMLADVHAAMLAALRAIREFNTDNDDAIRSVAIPGLGTGIGRLAPDAAVSQMRTAFEQFISEGS